MWVKYQAVLPLAPVGNSRSPSPFSCQQSRSSVSTSPHHLHHPSPVTDVMSCFPTSVNLLCGPPTSNLSILVLSPRQLTWSFPHMYTLGHVHLALFSTCFNLHLTWEGILVSWLKSGHLYWEIGSIQFASSNYAARTPTIYCKTIYKDFNLQNAIIAQSHHQPFCQDGAESSQGPSFQNRIVLIVNLFITDSVDRFSL